MDASGNHLDGAYLNRVNLGGAGAILGDASTAVSLDGSTEYIKLPSLGGFANGLTLAAWIYPTASIAWATFFDLGNGQAKGNIVLGRYSSNNDFYLQVYNGPSSNSYITTSGGAMEMNKWQFIAATISPSGSAVIYKNGRAIASGTLPVPDNVSRTSNYIGKSNWTGNYNFGGAVDEAAIYSTVLASDRIVNQYYTAVSQGAVLNRMNVGSGRYAIELDGANDVAISNLQVTGAEQGLVASNAARLTLAHNIAFNNAMRGFYIDTTVSDAILSGNTAYGTTGNAETDQDQQDFYLRGSHMTVNGNTAYMIGSRLGTGIYVDSASALTLINNLAFNNSSGLTVYLSQGMIHDNEARNNDRGLFVNDNDAAARTLVYQNNLHDNTAGLVLESNTEAYSNTTAANLGAGIYADNSAGDNTWVHDNYSVRNAIGIEAGFGRIYHNRVVGNSSRGLLFDYNVVYANGNLVYGNGVGIEVDGYAAGGTQLLNNLVYQNANQGIYIHGVQYNSPVRIINNTVYHDTGSAIRLENNSQPVYVYNNIIVINGGFGIELIGNATGFDSNYNDIFPTRPGANVGKYLAQTNSDTLAAWRTASGKDASSISSDPLFIDLNGPDNLLGWTQPDPQSQFADFGLDDNFHLRAHSPAIDAANSDVAPPLDAGGNARIDDLGTSNTGSGVYRFYDMGAFEFIGSSSDIAPPVVTALSPVGLANNSLSDAQFNTLVVRFSKPLDAISANSPSLYSLVEAGPDQLLGTGDDLVVPIASIGYMTGDVEVRLNFSGQLLQGLYRLTLYSTLTNAIVDQSGNALDGDNNGTAGGNFVRVFQLDLTPPTVASVTPNGPVGVGPTQFTIVFAENLQMNAATAANLANYSLVASIDETFGNADDTIESGRMTGVTYDPGTQTAILALSGALPARRYQLLVRSTITDQAGNALGNGATYVSLLQVGVPVLASIPNQSVYDGNLLTFTATASDPDGDSVAFSLGPNAPVGAGITSAGLFTWTPTPAQAGVLYNLKIIVSDNSVPPFTDSRTVAINVLPNLAPVLVSTTVNNGSAQRSRVTSLTLQFSDDVSASLTVSDLQLHNSTTGSDISPASIGLVYNPATNQATVTFPGLPNQQLPDGNYRLTVLAAGVLGPHGKPMAANSNFEFYVLTGDVNGDRVVNDRDLFEVWQNLLKPPASRNLNDDLTGDGQVTQADVNVVKGNYLAALPAPAPDVLLVTVNGGGTQRSNVTSLVVQFSDNVSASLGTSDAALRNLTTSADISPASLALSYDAATNRARLTFPGLAGQKLADGNYRLTILAGGVSDAFGHPMAADYTFAFYVLTGDVNGDRVVNDRDLYEVWQNLLKPPASRNLNDDLTGDGQVTQADVNVVKGNYLATLPAPGPAVLQVTLNGAVAQPSNVTSLAVQFSGNVSVSPGANNSSLPSALSVPVPTVMTQPKPARSAPATPNSSTAVAPRATITLVNLNRTASSALSPQDAEGAGVRNQTLASAGMGWDAENWTLPETTAFGVEGEEEAQPRGLRKAHLRATVAKPALAVRGYVIRNWYNPLQR